MIRRAAGALLVLAAVAGPVAAQTPMQQMPPDTGFMAAVAGEINAVAGFSPPDFTLAVADDGYLAFYGKETNRLEGVRCERTAAFQFVALANLTGAIRVGICTSEAKRVRALAAAAPRALDALLAQLSGNGVKIDADMRAKAGWTTTRGQAGNGTEEHAFPVIAVGHGLIAAQTVVLIQRNTRQAIVVQADTTKLCEPHYGVKEKPLCRDPRQALFDIARRLEARFAK